MKNSLKKMLGIFLGIIIFYNNFCYADVAFINPVEVSMRYLIIPIVIIVLVISGISYFVLRATASKENEDEDTMLNVDRKIIFVSSFIIVVMASVVYIIEGKDSNYHFPAQIFIVIMAMFELSILLKIIKKKKLANILIVISALTMCIASTYTSINSRTRETPPEYKITVFNSKFTKYEGDRVPGTQVKALIDEVLAINNDEYCKSS